MANCEDCPAGKQQDVMAYRIEQTEASLIEIKLTLRDMAASMRTVALLEERNVVSKDAIARAFGAIEGISVRMLAVENEMPGLKRVSSVVWATLVSSAAMLGTVVWWVITHVK